VLNSKRDRHVRACYRAAERSDCSDFVDMPWKLPFIGRSPELAWSPMSLAAVSAVPAHPESRKQCLGDVH
jgi:hypothetical protein